jgi:Tol biopolymer transport system component
MNDAELTTLFGTAEIDPEPPLPAAFVERALARGRHLARRRRVTTAVVTAAVLILVVLTVPWRPGQRAAPEPAEPRRPASLPEQFASYSPFTASAWSSPAGRAIALYESGSTDLLATGQTLVAGADRDTYRYLDREDDSPPTMRLSPDGEHVLFHRYRRGTDEFTLLDLSTGRSRVLHDVPWISNVGATVDMLAWSPDGRYVAYAVPAPPPADGKAESSFFAGRFIQQLAILDIVNDTTRRFPDIGPIWAAAFAPDSRHLAVQIGYEAWVITVDGERVRPLAVPVGMQVVSDTGWSPDGTRIAVTVGDTMAFVDAAGAAGGPRDRIPYNQLLAWRDPTRILTVPDERGDLTIAEVDLDSGTSTVVSTFSTARLCAYGTSRCSAFRVQLATGLIASATMRSSDPDRGPWPPSLQVAAIVIVGVVGLLAWRVTRRLRASSVRWGPARFRRSDRGGATGAAAGYPGRGPVP